jgi:hypothetical protein
MHFSLIEIEFRFCIFLIIKGLGDSLDKLI